jgi:hydroxymethylpyrimidine pyrophosphatase-like HAD family hydrolase
MRFLAFATDYDETLADHGRVPPATIEALARLKDSGRKLLLVTGRTLDELLPVFPQVDLFDVVLADNGALLYLPQKRASRPLGEPPPPIFVERLRALGVDPIIVGQVIVSTREPHETAVLETIRALGLELQVIFNKGAVMVLPSGMNKGAGLKAGLCELGLSPHNAVAIGDAENDHAFLAAAECAVAVANALPSLKEHADVITEGVASEGVVDLIDNLLHDDLAELTGGLPRHDVHLGYDDAGEAVGLPAHARVLFAGPSGAGKSTAAKAFLERLMDAGYQCCILDPEGDYEGFGATVSLGDGHRPPTCDEVLQVLAKPDPQVAVNLLGLKVDDRPAFFCGLVPRLQELRSRTGRPHTLIVDEAHHLAPASNETLAVPEGLEGLVIITVIPHEVSPALLKRVDAVVSVGDDALETVADFCRVAGVPAPHKPAPRLERGQVALWRPGRQALERVQVTPTRHDHHRHIRKYAEGELAVDRSFHFRGADGQLNLRAQNLTLFMQIADGVDDATWMHHLRRGDYSRWFGRVLKDPQLAEAARAIEADGKISPRDSRAALRAIIEERYTLPAESP